MPPSDANHSGYDPVERPRHYLCHGGIEPFDFISSNNLDFAQGNIIKYVLRFHEKGGVVDLEKARWYIDRLIEQANSDAFDVIGSGADGPKS